MQLKKITTFFLITLPLSALLRFFQLKFIIDPKNGFFYPEYETIGIVSTVIIFLLVAASVIFSFNAFRSPESAPKENIPLNIASITLGGVIILSTLFENTPVTTSQALTSLKSIFAVLAAAFFIAFGTQKYLKFKLPEIFCCLPVIYFVLSAISKFTVIASIALITDNLILITSICALMLFFLHYAMLYNNMDAEKNFRKLLASGTAAAMLSVTQSAVYFIYNGITAFEQAHTSVFVNLELLAAGIFVIIFLFSHFTQKKIDQNV